MRYHTLDDVAEIFCRHVLVTLLCYLLSQITFDVMTIGPSVPIEIAFEVLRELPPALLDMSWRSTLLGLCLVWYLARHHHPSSPRRAGD